jgi:hypothetical protein
MAGISEPGPPGPLYAVTDGEMSGEYFFAICFLTPGRLRQLLPIHAAKYFWTNFFLPQLGHKAFTQVISSDLVAILHF